MQTRLLAFKIELMVGSSDDFTNSDDLETLKKYESAPLTVFITQEELSTFLSNKVLSQGLDLAELEKRPGP